LTFLRPAVKDYEYETQHFPIPGCVVYAAMVYIFPLILVRIMYIMLNEIITKLIG